MAAVVAALADATACPMCAGQNAVSLQIVGGLAPVRTILCPMHVDARPLAEYLSRLTPPPAGAR